CSIASTAASLRAAPKPCGDAGNLLPMSVHEQVLRRGALRRQTLQHEWNVLRVIASTELKLKYTNSALGYVWSVIKPLSYFVVLWLVFGRVFRLGVVFKQYPLYLLIGIVLWTFFADAAALGMYSLVGRGALLRRLAFPRLVIPVSATLVAAITFVINLGLVGIFVAVSHERPRLAWLLIP